MPDRTHSANAGMVSERFHPVAMTASVISRAGGDRDIFAWSMERGHGRIHRQ
jgi:hypothetical protein